MKEPAYRSRMVYIRSSLDDVVHVSHLGKNVCFINNLNLSQLI